MTLIFIILTSIKDKNDKEKGKITLKELSFLICVITCDKGNKVFSFLEVTLDRDKIVENVCSSVVSVLSLLSLFISAAHYRPIN